MGLVLLIWCLSLVLLFVLSRMRPRPVEMATAGLWDEGCTAASPAVPAVGGLACMGGKGKGQESGWVRHC